MYTIAQHYLYFMFFILYLSGQKLCEKNIYCISAVYHHLTCVSLSICLSVWFTKGSSHIVTVFFKTKLVSFGRWVVLSSLVWKKTKIAHWDLSIKLKKCTLKRHNIEWNIVLISFESVYCTVSLVYSLPMVPRVLW